MLFQTKETYFIEILVGTEGFELSENPRNGNLSPTLGSEGHRSIR